MSRVSNREPGASRRPLGSLGARSKSITRDPMPIPIPRGLPERMVVIEEINWAIAVDAYATFDALQAAGWSPEALGDAAQGYRAWWHAQVDASIDTATAFWVVS